MRTRREQGAATPPLDRVDGKSKTAVRHKEGYSRMIKRSILQEEMIIINICAPNSKTCKYMTQTDRTAGRKSNSTEAGGLINHFQ